MLKYIKLKYLLIAIIVFVVIYVAKLILSPSQSTVNYITSPVIKGNVEKTVLADGTISAFKQVSVGAQVSGQIKKLYVELGDEIKQGDMIAEIDDLKQSNDLKQSEAKLNSLEAQRTSKQAKLVNYQLTYERQLKLVKKGVGAQADLDSSKADLDAIKADIAALDADIVSAQVAVDTAKVNLGYTKIRSPIDGVIVAIPVDEGQTVNSVQSAPTIVKVAQLDKMTIEAQISEADVINVKKGMPVYFTILGQPNKRFDGLTLRAIQPAPESINSESSLATSASSSSSKTAIYYNGLFDVDNPEHILRISMTAQVYIVLAEAKDVLSIPSQAIVQTLADNKAIVYLLNSDNTVEERQVTLGINNNVSVEIQSGLKEGEIVIVSSTNGSQFSPNGRSPRIKF
ncbi:MULTISPECIES: efflux RND transporter periplasmic adaptor subunit [unclassified Gilliamella]|uniref:efflux RND transporter periplasmic adaptor subunit n=1 Tax=unclassified Gilliamella TaxID=2685620 RepID=UPI001C69CE95|nr:MULTISPECIES: efflux RND transporter periplasmic adaptor subunit [unclassified Gilliamella]MCX8602096.1 efflux RND transporter periplasmic adaptor subunit [Gilliamella sp. B3722]MCX8611430.1 efflux RND transporter periplasmic adaptor subunit [Gilliamella sp. B3891]MCX8613739.1 efflux RND transporter periplasmic adaptor subunit [Gilliamella sp. B3773]MCX8615175.1 efflux RND transporter periplasmic adaptor subunit [Gilliamella sp. B3770]MCX8619060.1 efflux RND transporter periplasmic adaptor 